MKITLYALKTEGKNSRNHLIEHCNVPELKKLQKKRVEKIIGINNFTQNLGSIFSRPKHNKNFFPFLLVFITFETVTVWIFKNKKLRHAILRSNAFELVSVSDEKDTLSQG